jgi:hypothetical protein
VKLFSIGTYHEAGHPALANRPLIYFSNNVFMQPENIIQDDIPMKSEGDNKKEMHEMMEKNRRLRNQVTSLQQRQKQKREEMRKMKRRGM